MMSGVVQIAHFAAMFLVDTMLHIVYQLCISCGLGHTY